MAFVLVVVIGTTSVRGQTGEGAALSIAQFVAVVDSLAARIDAADSPDARSAIIASLPPRWRIAHRGQEFSFSTAWVTARLQPAAADSSAWNAARLAVRTRLIAVRHEVAAAADTAAHPGNARELLTRVLAREEFQRSVAGRWRDDLQRLVGEWIEELLAGLGAGAGAGRRAGIVLAWVASLGALAALGLWIGRSLAQRRPETSLGLGETGRGNVRARELALRSLAAVRAGDVREAVRIAYRAALVRLEEQDVWRVDETRTPREYLALLHASDGRHAPMRALTRRFEQIWYGNHPADVADAAEVRTHLEELGCLRPGEQAT